MIYGDCGSALDPNRLFPDPDPTLKGISDPDPTFKVDSDPIPDPGQNPTFLPSLRKKFRTYFGVINNETIELCLPI